MRENSGQGEATNNMRDPTMRDHEGGKGPAQDSARGPDGNRTDIAGNVREHGEDPSPDNRARGETSGAERAPPVDIDAG